MKKVQNVVTTRATISNWALTNKVLSMIRSSENGMYIAEIARNIPNGRGDKTFSERAIADAVVPLVAANIVKSRHVRIQTSTGRRRCRLLQINRGAHIRSTTDLLMFEQIFAAPGRKYWEYTSMTGNTGHKVVQSVKRLKEKGLISLKPNVLPNNITASTIVSCEIRPVGVRV